MKVRAKGQLAEVWGGFRGLNEYTVQVQTGGDRCEILSSIGPLTGAESVSLPSLSGTEMGSSAEYQRPARVSERETERGEGTQGSELSGHFTPTTNHPI